MVDRKTFNVIIGLTFINDAQIKTTTFCSRFQTSCDIFLSLPVSGGDTPCLKKYRAKLFLSELRQNFHQFWQNNGKETKIMRGALIFHLI